MEQSKMFVWTANSGKCEGLKKIEEGENMARGNSSFFQFPSPPSGSRLLLKLPK